MISIIDELEKEIKSVYGTKENIPYEFLISIESFYRKIKHMTKYHARKMMYYWVINNKLDMKQYLVLSDIIHKKED